MSAFEYLLSIAVILLVAALVIWASLDAKLMNEKYEQGERDGKTMREVDEGGGA